MISDLNPQTKTSDAESQSTRHPTSDSLTSLLELSQHLKQVFIVRLIRNVVDVFVSELAFLIDDEECAFGNAVVLTIRTVGFSNFALRMKVAQQIVAESAEALGPGCIARHAVN